MRRNAGYDRVERARSKGPPAPRGTKTALAAAVSNRSKVNMLITIISVVCAQLVLCLIAVIIIILHHARIIDWFPALLEVTGRGYLVEVPPDY
ncbi:hypothetical protein RB195_003853 [Necator americanus]|uniref:Uncharacterized protein n=1 Tax=Necator americanus TaxID=51031 RepID=A0ABR1DQH0_NECAM